MKNNLEALMREYVNAPFVGPGRCRKEVLNDIIDLQGENVEADAYNIACELMEEGWRERAKRGVEIGTQGSLCDGISWIFGHMKKLESAAAPDLPDVPYSGLEQRFFQGLNTITRRAVLQVLGGHSDALMAQVRTRSDERRLFKRLFKAAVPDGVRSDMAFIAAYDQEYVDSRSHDQLRGLTMSLIARANRALLAAPAAQGDDQAASPTYAKFGYILQAADGHQTWLKGDPAAGMGRYGKIIQLYRKDGV